MPNRSLLWLFVFCAVCFAVSTEARQAATGEEYVGTWPGTWDGSGSGNFELTLEKAKDGGVTGRVAVTTDGGNYKADFTSLSFDGKKMNAKYEFPLDPAAEVAVTAVFEGSTAKGTWSLRPKGQETELIGGSWTVTRK